ncbi:MAG: glycerophosphodiester phosphodiesterase [Pirellulales bacterium]
MVAFLRLAACSFLIVAASPSARGQLIIAHRGASHDAPENTLSAFKLAIEQGADGFEADFYLGKDGHVVCLHDADTKRVAGKKLLAREAPFKELRSLDVGSWKGPQWKGEQMPTLEEVLAAVPDGKKIFIELKSSREVVGPMAKILAASKLSPEQVVVISFHADAIAECKKQLPHVKALWLCGMKKKKDGTPPPTAEHVAATFKRIGADGLDAEGVPEYFNAAFIERLRQLGCREFHVWTIDDPRVAEFYARLGAASITTNRPGWLRKEMAKGGGE